MNQHHSFNSLPLQDALLTNLASLNFRNMTPIQTESLPLMLKGLDVIAQAKTGSGKTAAFGLALLNRLNTERHTTQALVLCPTRELAEQVGHVLRRLARLIPNVKILNLSGGIPMRPQLDSLKHGAQVIVGTPGRVQKHIDAESLSLQHLQTLVLDEADRMLDMGFEDEIRRVISFCPKKRQTLLFSATYPDEIRQLANNLMRSPQHVTIQDTQATLNMTQVFYEVSSQANKFSLLKTLLCHHQPTSTLIFCNTKDQTTSLLTRLTKEGFITVALHGDMDQAARDRAMIRFANHSCSILVATDVAARGLDIQDLPAVINYDLAFDHDVHVHRIGRTGRAGNQGLALSLTTPHDAGRLCELEDKGFRIPWGDIRALDTKYTTLPKPEMVTLSIAAGRKDKIRPGDILGALTQDAGLDARDIGKIDISAMYAYVAIKQNQLKKAYPFIKHAKLKGKTTRMNILKGA
ncbi:MAG: ATP-dependent RNA helicase DbpA [Legionella sp.]|nr:ATP-dependent RNA helicase DbpA [Legionella sp.]